MAPWGLDKLAFWRKEEPPRKGKPRKGKPSKAKPGKAKPKRKGKPTRVEAIRKWVKPRWAKARKWVAKEWKDNRVALLSITAFAVVIFFFAGYALLRRPGDISNPGAVFSSGAETKPVVGVADWPLYGLDEERTRYLNAPDVKPPFGVKWRFKGNRLLEYSPILVGGSLYGINNNGLAFSVKTRNGKARWKREVATRNASSPAFSDGLLYISNLDPGQVVALDARGGEHVWTHPLPGRSESSPVVVGDEVIVGCENGSLFALDKNSGRTLWETELGGAVKAAPAISSDGAVAYVGTYSGDFYGVNLSDGSIKWKAGSQGGSFGQAGAFYSTAAVAFGRVYVASKDSRVYSFEQDTGELAWSHSLDGELYAGVVAADTPNTDPTVYLGSYGGGTFYALDAKSGDERWSIDAGGSVIGAASLIDETVYFANLDNTETIGVNASNGDKEFTFRDGAYNPVISDGKRLYLTGYKTIYALKPGDAPSQDGVIPKKPKPKAQPPAPPSG
jgi:outer membrane protein assembly factor BamB